MSKTVTKYRRSLRKGSFQGTDYQYFRGSTLVTASPVFSNKTEARKWLKNDNKKKRKKR